MKQWLSNQLEPSRLRATIIAGFAFAASLGLVTSSDVPGWVDVVLPVAAILIPYIQHWLVRPVVTPTAKIAAAVEAAGAGPDRYIDSKAKAELEAMLVTGEQEVPVP
jgi:hypothetical protein